MLAPHHGAFTTLASCFLLAILGTPGLASGNTLMKPELSIQGDQVMIQAGGTFDITCRGLAAMIWTWGSEPAGSRARILEHPCADNPVVTCNQLTIFHTEAGDTGYFTCSYKDVDDTEDPNGKTSVYVYVKDDSQVFVQTYYDTPSVIMVFTGTQEVVVPCRVTSPDIDVKLQLVSYIVRGPDEDLPLFRVWNIELGSSISVSYLLLAPAMPLGRIYKQIRYHFALDQCCTN
uniref:VEGFR1-3 N-terminal Ig-like domain-containing protein n=1 Tax=Oryctolagus cuniculus TaxID=9986 RepID=A0A5F9DNR9_RABIT